MKVKDLNTKQKIGLLSQNLYGWQCYENKDGEIVLTDKFKDEVKKYDGIGFLYGLNRSDPWSGRDFLSGLTLNDSMKARKLMDEYINENTTHGIPITYVEEAPHGHQALESTLLPTNMTIGASWNKELVEKAYSYVGYEMSNRGSSIALLSVMDVLRDPRWGRSEECYSEDPFLSKEMALATVKGASKNIGVVAKHFAAQGSNEGGRNGAGATIGDRELNEIHLPSPKAVIESKLPVGIMAAYNHIDGIYCHASDSLLKDLLRKEWLYSGIVMSDGCAVDNLVRQTGTDVDALSLAWNSGVNVDLWNRTFLSFEEAIDKGKISSDVLNESVERVLELKERIASIKPSVVSKDFELDLATESMVLIKNDNILPIKDEDVLLTGPHIENVYHLLGDYTPFQKNESDNSIASVFKDEFKNIQIIKGTNINSDDKSFEDISWIASKSKYVILTLGTTSARDFKTEFMSNGALKETNKKLEMNCGEGADTASIDLHPSQVRLFNEIYKVNKNIIVLLISGRPMAIEEIISKARAVIVCGYPGTSGAKALVNLLKGESNFSGKLPYSLPHHSNALPCFYNYKDYANYVDVPTKINDWKYKFGFGLSYSKFIFSNAKVCCDSLTTSEIKSGKKFKISIDVENDSNNDGKEVVQVFIKRKTSKFSPRVKELKGFEKVSLSSHEKKTISFELGFDELQEYVENYKWDVLPSQIELSIGDYSFNVETINLEVK